MNYTSQAGQDKWVSKFFDNHENRFFVEVGGYDGITFSNTYHLEKDLKWKGIIVEGSQLLFPKITKIRDCICVNSAIYKEDTTVQFSTGTHPINKWDGKIRTSGKETVRAITMKTLFEECIAPKIIDYISMDIEGAEYDALTKFPFDTHVAILWTIEHNLYIKNDPTLKNNIKKIMLANNYVLAAENVSPVNPTKRPDIPFEDWYIHKDYK